DIIVKTIGLLGGMSWESTLEYYRLINLYTKDLFGESHSAKCILYSFDYHELELLLHQNRWDEITKQLVEHGKKLKAYGADFLVICANTMHIVAADVEKQVGLKIVHIVEATRNEIIKLGLSKVGLLGTKFTMESSMYPKMMEIHDIEVILPTKKEQKLIHQTIYQELILGNYSNESKNKFIEIIHDMKQRGAEGVILGCTEIPLLIHDKDVDIAVLNTMKIHAFAAVYESK
ncbi:MAG: aspartate/glutamate racemase family protein, partial [Bacillota bacterium]